MKLLFLLFFSFVVLQRIIELGIARKNERWMRLNGAIEFGKPHYKVMVLLHMAFILSFLLEVIILEKTLHPYWMVLVTLFVGTQLLRGWAIYSLGSFWNTKILIVPNASIVKSGPYRFLRHPNYLIVVLEIILIPILFQAYITAVCFTFLNAWMLSVRIPIEEKALSQTTSNYAAYVKSKKRFSPSFTKNIE